MGFLDRFRRKECKTVFGSGSGRSKEDAIVILVRNEVAGVIAEHAYISRECGRREVDWTLELQALYEGTEEGSHYDKFVVRLRDGQIREYWFEISNFYGRL